MRCPIPRPARRASLYIGLGFLALATPAGANGRFPSSQYVLMGPGAATTTIVLRTTFGVIQSNDSGIHWAWMCEQMFGYGSRSNIDPAVALGAVAPDGIPLILGLPDGVARATDFCTSTRNPQLANRYAGDMTTDPTGASVYWVGADSSTASTVWRSTDGGQSYTQLGPGVPAVTFTTIEVAPSNPLRIYLAGDSLTPYATVMYRSDDGGMTVQQLPGNVLGGVDAWISGVDATDPDVLYVRSHTAAPDGGAPGTMLLKSIDAGMTFSLLWQSVGDMKGFALSDDGQTVWAGGDDPADQLQRSDHGGAFHRVASLPVLCLRWHAGQLLVCSNDDVPNGFALGRSMDQGMTIEPILRFANLPCSNGCAPGTVGHDYCELQWPEILDLISPLVVTDGGSVASPLDAGTLTMDAGARTMDAALHASPIPRPSSGCAVAPLRTSLALHRTPWFTVVAAAMLRRRRRAGGSVRPR